MTIQTFPNTLAGEAAAASVPDPKAIWYNVPKGIVVMTGADIPPAIPVDADLAYIKAYNKAVALRGMNASQMSAWFDANVTNFAQAQDAMKTMGIILSYILKQYI